MTSALSRREFLRLGGLSLGGIFANLSSGRLASAPVGSIGRVAYESVSVFDAPRLDANTLSYRFRDELLNIFHSITPLAGPAYNPLWYRISDGYVHSALVQPVGIQYNQALETLPESGLLFRVTVPYTQPYSFSSSGGWQVESRYLLYYGSNHWVTDIVEGHDGNAWYQITEAWEGVRYYAAAPHLEPYDSAELTPVAPDVPAADKRIEVSLERQMLTAYEGDRVVLRAPVATGVRNSSLNDGLPTETPTGVFNITSKLSAKYMGANRLTDTLGDRFLPGVPWTAFFAEGGYALHGAYWHNNFGAPMSQGCINIRPDYAQWLYRWTTPIAQPDEWEARGFGTRIVIR